MIWLVLITSVNLQEEIDKRLTEILGPKTEADNVKPVKKKKEKPAKVEVCYLKFNQVLWQDCLVISSASSSFVSDKI